MNTPPVKSEPAPTKENTATKEAEQPAKSAPEPAKQIETTPTAVAAAKSTDQPLAIASPKVTNNEVTISPTAIASTVCPACKGKGKITQAEIRKNRMVTKDISNGLGPRNFVTYTVNEVVRPAGNVSCGKCGGTGKIIED